MAIAGEALVQRESWQRVSGYLLLTISRFAHLVDEIDLRVVKLLEDLEWDPEFQFQERYYAYEALIDSMRMVSLLVGLRRGTSQTKPEG